MTQHARAALRALSASLWLAVALAGPGCLKRVKPEAGEDRTVESGVVVDFGSAAPEAPQVTWDFGDGSPVQQGARVSHAFPRAGAYTVRALDKDDVLASARLTVVARPVLRAIPEDAEVAVFFPQMRDNVEPVLAFFARIAGEEQARQTLETVPLLSMVVREVRGQGRLVDVEEGLGFFSLPGFDGTVALMGVTDAQAAQEAVVKELQAAGAVVSQREGGGGVLLHRETGVPLLLFADRGYLYLVVPDAPEKEAPTTADATGGSPPVEQGPDGVDAVRTRITGLSGPGLSELPLLTLLRSKVGAGNVHMFARPEAKDASEGFQGAWASLKMAGMQADLEGWVASDKSFFSGGSAPAPALLSKAPRGPIAALTMSIPPEELTRLAFGTPGSDRRERTMLKLREEGLDAANAEALLGALRGDLALLAYFDAPAFYRNFVQGNRKPDPRGTLLFHAGLVRSEPVLAWLTGQLKERAQPYEVSKDAGATRLTTKAFGQPVELTVTADALTLRGGESLQERAPADVGALLRERFGPQTFGPGHLSLGVDVGRLRAELDADVPGVPAQQLPMARALVSTVMEQLPPIDSVFLDFAPEEGGGRFRARALLRAR